jgi:uncharacterized surface protein with fasciclin (FAS1) repeats
MNRIRMSAAAALGALVVVAFASTAGATRPAAESPAAMKPSMNIVQTAVAAGQFTTLVKLVKTAGLAPTLSGKGPFTVFAPTDAAFAKVPKKTLKALLADKAQLRRVLLYHVVAGDGRDEIPVGDGDEAPVEPADDEECCCGGIERLHEMRPLSG